ncbi:hypothetical protein [Methylorubrum extorquens]|uniref:hypothetical protein n=1 Tax=Methylorubrum extorquens TaxID=408 RepID=UPI00209DEF68|nr:hypothetical protein [Methylorubrum extorquens]MCP1540110.1 hypothetical protein [Methylorubrum extorquens]
MDLHALGFAAGLLAGGLVATLIASIRHDKDRRHARRFRSAADLALHQNETMQNTRASRGPCGQDWCDLYDELQPHERN